MPDVPEDLEDVIDAFYILTRSRQAGFDIGPIPLNQIETYCRMYRIDDVDRMVRLIGAMDGEYLLTVHEKRKP
jgi:hypothetical protein